MGLRAILMLPVDMNLRTMVQASMLLRERSRGFALCKKQSRERRAAYIKLKSCEVDTPTST